MAQKLFYRPVATGTTVFIAASTMTSIAAIAACNGAPSLVALSSIVAPPSISATESSTDQALELIRRRREEASGSCPAGFVRSGGNCVPAAQQASAPAVVAQAPIPAATVAPPVAVTTTTTSGQAAAAPPAAKASPAVKAPPVAAAKAPPAQVAQAPAPRPVVRSAPAQAQPVVGYRAASIKDSDYDTPVAGTVRMHGAWAEGYYDHERRSDLNPNGGPTNNPTRRMTTNGFAAGVDVGHFTVGQHVSGFQLGFMGGGSATRSRFTDTTSVKFQPTVNDTQLTLSQNQRQEIDGGFAGIYGTFAHGKWSGDVIFKVDMLDFEQSSIDTLLGGCGTVIPRFDQTSMTNYVAASNLNYRFDLSPNHYLEPTIGIRYTSVNYGSNAAVLGVRDGEVFRVQGGLRLGMRYAAPNGWLWNSTIGGLLYSDVSMSGLVLPSTVTNPSFPLVDEGKLRVMGVVETRVNIGYGFTLYGGADVRGGEGLIGYGARGGIRLQW